MLSWPSSYNRPCQGTTHRDTLQLLNREAWLTTHRCRDSSTCSHRLHYKTSPLFTSNSKYVPGLTWGTVISESKNLTLIFEFAFCHKVVLAEGKGQHSRLTIVAIDNHSSYSYFQRIWRLWEIKLPSLNSQKPIPTLGLTTRTTTRWCSIYHNYVRSIKSRSQIQQEEKQH